MIKTCRMELGALHGVQAAAELWIPHSQAAVTLTASRHYSTPIRGELPTRHCPAVPSEHLPSRQLSHNFQSIVAAQSHSAEGSIETPQQLSYLSATLGIREDALNTSALQYS